MLTILTMLGKRISIKKISVKKIVSVMLSMLTILTMLATFNATTLTVYQIFLFQFFAIVMLTILTMLTMLGTKIWNSKNFLKKKIASILENTSGFSGDIERVKIRFIIVRNGIMWISFQASLEVLSWMYHLISCQLSCPHPPCIGVLPLPRSTREQHTLLRCTVGQFLDFWICKRTAPLSQPNILRFG